MPTVLMDLRYCGNCGNSIFRIKDGKGTPCGQSAMTNDPCSRKNNLRLWIPLTYKGN